MSELKIVGKTEPQPPNTSEPQTEWEPEAAKDLAFKIAEAMHADWLDDGVLTDCWGEDALFIKNDVPKIAAFLRPFLESVKSSPTHDDVLQLQQRLRERTEQSMFSWRRDAERIHKLQEENASLRRQINSITNPLP